MGSEISRAAVVDHDAILELHHEAGWAQSRVDGEVWVARENGELVGSLQFEELPCGLLFIRAMVVRADSRGRGIGGRMLDEILETRLSDWWLECRDERIPFYSKHGFHVVQEQVIPAAVRELVRPRTDRRQNFMHRET
ncbi:MAG: GNAT family N-acetyltransferase [Actinobacteria bacterium]|nr:GNAT family N-acetyltransferase [Actinomycetota bacterium]